LRASEERFRAYVTASSDVVYRMSADWKEMRFLEGKEFIVDTFDTSENWIEKYLHPDDQPNVMKAISEAIANKTVFDLEHRVMRADGVLGWVQSRAVPMLGLNGEITEWFGAARDITEEKRGEETQQLLLSELNHRVKNMLASIHAIARQTLRTASDPAAFAESFSGRLQSMSRMHSLLTSTGWAGADLHEVIRNQLPAGSAEDKRVSVSGPALRLGPQMALHSALMLHELGTNSLKYGALSKPDGKVWITWVVSDNSLCLEWREKGGPPITVPLKRGFGTTLIEQTVSSEGGSAHRSVEGDGMHWQITLPLAGAEEAAPKTPANIRAPMPRTSRRATISRPASIEAKVFAVIEDEPLIAMNIAMLLEQAGAQVAGPAATVSDALDLIAKNELDGALLDANLRGQPAGEIAAALTRKAIPFVFVTGYGREVLPRSFARAPMLKKPFTEEQLLAAAASLLEQPRAVLRLRE
jgi:two-component sensor histidine kinase/CheY-like chemotaxis protein